MEENKDVLIFMRLLYACVFGDANAYPSADDINWSFVYSLGLKNDVISLLLPAFKLYASRGEVKKELLSVAERRSCTLAYEEVKKSDYTSRVIKKLNENGIRVILLKGPFLKALYPYPELRRMSDLDVIAINATCEDIFNILKLSFDCNIAEGDFSHIVVDNVLNVDLNDAIYPAGDRALFGEDCLNCSITSEKTAVFNFYGNSFLTLAPTENVVYLSYHMFKHFILGGIGIRQMCDFALFVSRLGNNVDWKLAFERAEKIKMKKFLASLLKISGIYFNVDVSDFLLDNSDIISDEDVYEILCDMLEGGVFGVSSPHRELARSIVWRKVREHNSGEKNGILKILFPPYKNMKENFSYVSRHPVLLPVSWVHRIVRFLRMRLFSGKKWKIIRAASKAAEKRLEIMDSLDL